LLEKERDQEVRVVVLLEKEREDRHCIDEENRYISLFLGCCPNLDTSPRKSESDVMTGRKSGGFSVKKFILQVIKKI